MAKKCKWEIDDVGYSITELKLKGAKYLKEKEVLGIEIVSEKDPSGKKAFSLKVKVCK